MNWNAKKVSLLISHEGRCSKYKGSLAIAENNGLFHLCISGNFNDVARCHGRWKDFVHGLRDQAKERHATHINKGLSKVPRKFRNSCSIRKVKRLFHK